MADMGVYPQRHRIPRLPGNRTEAVLKLRDSVWKAAEKVSALFETAPPRNVMP
jgi:hypothetical protein